MSKKRYRPEEIVRKLREADILISQGKSVSQAIKSLGVSEVTYYRWRKEYSGVLQWGQFSPFNLLEFHQTRLALFLLPFPDIGKENPNGQTPEDSIPECHVSYH